MTTSSIDTGDIAPDFTLPSTDGEISLSGLLDGNRAAIVAFYFEDGTPTCENEVAMLKDAFETVREFSAGVVAISADSLDSHRSFAERLGGVPFPLASDTALQAAKAYGVVDEGDPRRSRRAVFVVGTDRKVSLAIPLFQPNNLSQVESILSALAPPDG